MVFPAIIALLLSSCSNQGLYEPSEFARDLDPGKVIESFLGMMWNDEQEEIPNKTFGFMATHTQHSYFKV